MTDGHDDAPPLGHHLLVGLPEARVSTTEGTVTAQHDQAAPFQLFDALDADTYQALKASIRERGVQIPIVLDEDGRIIDGHHRHRAWTELRAEGVSVEDFPTMILVGLDDDEKRRRVIELNLYRRHLTPETRARMIRELRAGGMTLQAIADAAGVAVSTVHADLRDPEIQDRNSEPATIVNARGQQRPTTYKPRATPIVFATTQRQRLAVLDAAAAGVLGELPASIVPADHKIIRDGAKQVRRLREAARRATLPSVELGAPDAPRLEVADALDMPLDDASVDVVITSPPYGLEKPYRGHLDLAAGWEQFMRDWLTEAFRVLRSPGRLILNVPMSTALGGFRDTWPQASLAAKHAGFAYRDEILWDKGNSTKGHLSLGSQESANAPYPVAEVEVIGLFFKGAWKLGGDRASDMTHEEWQAWGNGLWKLPGETRPWEDHPAPFTEELVSRLLRYLTRIGDDVLDPFVGSGTTAVAARRLGGRRVIGFDRDPDCIAGSKRRLVHEGLAT